MLNHGMSFLLFGAGHIYHFAYRPFLIAAALYEGEPCFLGENNWQNLAAILRAEDSQKQSERSFYIDVYESIFMELVKWPGYVKEAREIISVLSNRATVLAQRIHMTCDHLRKLNDELRSLLVSNNQRKEGIFTIFVGQEPNAFPETSPSLLLGAAVNTLRILEQLHNRLTTPFYVRVETPFSSCGARLSLSDPRSATTTNGGGPLLDFCFTCELGECTEKDGPRAFTWLDRVVGSMGLLGAELIYEDAIEVGKACYVV